MADRTPAEHALADAYTDWLQLIVDDAAGMKHPPTDYKEAYQLILEAEKGVPDRDRIWREAKTEWETVMRVDAVTGKPTRAPKHPVASDAPQGEMLR
jgi:hypothetical protein